MGISIKNEIIHLGLSAQSANVEHAGRRLTSEETHVMLTQQNPQELIVIDARNNYESRIGAFVNVVRPDIKNFRETKGDHERNLPSRRWHT